MAPRADLLLAALVELARDFRTRGAVEVSDVLFAVAHGLAPDDPAEAELIGVLHRAAEKYLRETCATAKTQKDLSLLLRGELALLIKERGELLFFDVEDEETAQEPDARWRRFVDKLVGRSAAPAEGFARLLVQHGTPLGLFRDGVQPEALAKVLRSPRDAVARSKTKPTMGDLARALLRAAGLEAKAADNVIEAGRRVADKRRALRS